MAIMDTIKNSVLTFDDVSIKYENDNALVLKNINFSVKNNEIVAIIGKSGQGKTTLFKSISHVVKVVNGNIWFNNINLTKLSKRKRIKELKQVSFLNQENTLIDEKTVFQNCLVFSKNWINSILHVVTKKQAEKIYRVLKNLNIFDKSHTLIKELSGGEKQRVECAITLLEKPKLLLADEPTSNLDHQNAVNIINLLLTIQKELNCPLIINLHDVDLVKKYATRIIGVKDQGILFDVQSKDLSEKLLMDLYA